MSSSWANYDANSNRQKDRNDETSCRDAPPLKKQVIALDRDDIQTNKFNQPPPHLNSWLSFWPEYFLPIVIKQDIGSLFTIVTILLFKVPTSGNTSSACSCFWSRWLACFTCGGGWKQSWPLFSLTFFFFFFLLLSFWVYCFSLTSFSIFAVACWVLHRASKRRDPGI